MAEDFAPVLEAARLSVQPREDAGVLPPAIALWWFGAGQGQPLPPWGTSIFERDYELQRFLEKESFLAGAVVSICARNAGYSWSIKGDDESLVQASVTMLENSDFGAGWVSLAMRLTYNLLTQDTGAFVEVIRSGPAATDPIVGLSMLPAGRCYATGDPDTPAIFIDRRGKYHKLRWWQVIHLLEMPVDHPVQSGLQLCGVSRCMQQAETFYGMAQYRNEKVNGRHSRAIHVISGITRNELDSAVQLAAAIAQNRGLLRYQPPVIIPAMQQNQEAKIATLELASLPDGFDMEQEFKQYISLLAMALLAEYQEFAPLPGGGLGTGAQSETLDQKARMKGSAIWRKLVANAINNVLPDGVRFVFDEEDVDEAKRRADVQKVRAEARQVRVASGEIDEIVARELAVSAGDLSPEQMDALSLRDVERNEAEAEQAESEAERTSQEMKLRFGQQQPTAGAPDQATMSNDETGDGGETGAKANDLFAESVTASRLEAEDDATSFFGDQLKRMWRGLRRSAHED